MMKRFFLFLLAIVLAFLLVSCQKTELPLPTESSGFSQQESAADSQKDRENSSRAENSQPISESGVFSSASQKENGTKLGNPIYEEEVLQVIEEYFFLENLQGEDNTFHFPRFSYGMSLEEVLETERNLEVLAEYEGIDHEKICKMGKMTLAGEEFDFFLYFGKEGLNRCLLDLQKTEGGLKPIYDYLSAELEERYELDEESELEEIEVPVLGKKGEVRFYDKCRSRQAYGASEDGSSSSLTLECFEKDSKDVRIQLDTYFLEKNQG